MNFSLNGFKKVSREGNNTTLQHPAGHELVINHSTLSPKMRGEIEALPHISEKHPDTIKPKTPDTPKFADGGEAKRQIPTKDESNPSPEDKQEYDENMKSFAVKDKESDKQNRELASEPQKYAEGTPDEPVRQDQEADKRVTEQNAAEAAKETADQSAAAAKDKADYEAYKAKQPETEDTRPGRNNIDDVIAAHKNLTDSHNAIVQALAGSQPTQTANQSQSTATSPQPSVQSPAPATPDQGQMVMPVTPEDRAAAGLPTALQQETQTASQPPSQTQPESQTPGSATPSGYQSDISAAQKGITDLASYTADHEAKNQQLFDAVSQGKVDPKRYFSNLDTAGKIANIIGLVMGGLGANATGGRNLAVDSMNHLIEQDVDAQKANIAQGTNLYKLNLEKTKNEQEARSMTINQQLTMAQAVLAKQAAGTTNALALANIQKTNQEITGLKLQNDMSAYKVKILNEVGNGSNLQPGQPDQDRLNKLILSGVMPKEDAILARKEVQNYQEAQNLRQDFEDSAKHLDSKIGAGMFSPGDKESATNAFAGRIARVAEGRFNLQEAGLQAKALLPQPGDLPSTSKNKVQRRAAFFDSLTPTTTLESYGILKPRPSSSAIKTMNGIPYQLGADGQYYRVK